MSRTAFDPRSLFTDGRGCLIDVNAPDGLFVDADGTLWARNLATGEDRGLKLPYGVGVDTRGRKFAFSAPFGQNDDAWNAAADKWLAGERDHMPTPSASTR